MRSANVIGIDLAKQSFQVAVLKNQQTFIANRTLGRSAVARWLARQPASIVAMEACGSAHYWARQASRMGHYPRILSPKAVAPFRQGHKTDKNDAQAIAVAACQPHVRRVAPKSIEQQGLQSIERMRQHRVDHITATSNLLRSVLMEFGLVIAKGYRALRQAIPRLLEQADNELPEPLRHEIVTLYNSLCQEQAALRELEQRLDGLIKQQAECQQLLQLEGVGPVNALGLFLVLGERGSSFKHGREAAACIGLTPKQYSTGGKVVLGGIARMAGPGRLRANLIQGALAMASALDKREPRNGKEAWLKALIDRRGKRRAAVALANKTVRTAWAMLHHEEGYRAPRAMAA